MSAAHDLSITDLCAATGVSRRTVHYYIGLGLLPRPAGRGGGARYGESHVETLRAIARMKAARVKLDEMRDILERRDPKWVYPASTSAVAEGGGGWADLPVRQKPPSTVWSLVTLEDGALELKVNAKASAEARARADAIIEYHRSLLEPGGAKPVEGSGRE